jgi:L-lactate dehydrogenase complex protein LldG
VEEPTPSGEIKMSARDEILARLGTAAPSGDLGLERRYLRRHHSDGLADLLAERVAHYRATVHRTAAGDLPAALGRVLRDGFYLVPPGLPAAWTAGLDDRLAPVGSDLVDSELEAAAGVITGCAVAIAETGTLVLDHGPGQGRRALTLVPDHHLVVVTADRIVADVPDAVARLDFTRPLTFVSGPSATSDIELSRVEGVHGPRTLEVFFI